MKCLYRQAARISSAMWLRPLGPLIVLLGRLRADHTDDGVAAREDPGRDGAACARFHKALPRKRLAHRRYPWRLPVMPLTARPSLWREPNRVGVAVSALLVSLRHRRLMWCGRKG